MDQDVEVVGAADALGDTTALGAVTGDCDYDDVRLTGSRKRFRRLAPGDIHLLENGDIVEILMIRGRNARGVDRGLIRVRAGANCHLTGPLEWRPSRVSPRWDPVPAEIARMTAWINLCIATILVGSAAWLAIGAVASSLKEGGGLTFEQDFMIHGMMMVVGILYGGRSRRRLFQARRRAKVMAVEPSSFRVASVYPSSTVCASWPIAQARPGQVEAAV